MERKEIEEDFYRKVGEILGVQSEYRDANPCAGWSHRSQSVVQRSTKATRYLGRSPGNGRFPGFGMVRMFGANCIQVVLTRPEIVSRTFSGPDDALAFLMQLMEMAEITG